MALRRVACCDLASLRSPRVSVHTTSHGEPASSTGRRSAPTTIDTVTPRSARSSTTPPDWLTASRNSPQSSPPQPAPHWHAPPQATGHVSGPVASQAPVHEARVRNVPRSHCLQACEYLGLASPPSRRIAQRRSVRRAAKFSEGVSSESATYRALRRGALARPRCAPI